MKKKLSILLLFFFAVLLLSGFTYQSGKYVYDTTGTLTDSEISALESRIRTARESVGSDFVIYIVETGGYQDDAVLRRNAENAVDDWVRATGGYDENGQTVLFYLDLSGNYFIDEYNATEKYKLSDWDIDAITDTDSDLFYYLKGHDWYHACETCVEQAERKARPGFFETIWGKIITALGGGGAAAGVALGVHRTRKETTKRYYMKQASFRTVMQDDAYLGTRTTVHKIQTESSGGGGHISSGGGSSGHHGGGGHF